MGALAACVDFVNLMAYDFREPEADAEAGHHANLFPHPSDRKGLSADRAVREFLAAGVPPGKLVLGVPFYGRAWADVRPRHGGLYQPGKPPRPPFDTRYGSLAAGFIGHGGYVRRWDRRSQAPFLWNASKRVFISYDDPESLRRKCRYVRERGLAGAMFWEYYADGGGALLRTLAAELRRVRDRVSPRPARRSDSRGSGR
jgi:chitinase